MDNKKSPVKKQTTKAPQQPLETKPQGTSGPEIWDGNSAGWTLVVNGRKRNKNKK
jgi:hypothetical protein